MVCSESRKSGCNPVRGRVCITIFKSRAVWIQSNPSGGFVRFVVFSLFCGRVDTCVACRLSPVGMTGGRGMRKWEIRNLSSKSLGICFYSEAEDPEVSLVAGTVVQGMEGKGAERKVKFSEIPRIKEDFRGLFRFCRQCRTGRNSCAITTNAVETMGWGDRYCNPPNPESQEYQC